MPINPSIAHLSRLVGTWRGSGHGEYPTITSFDYTDEWQFIDIGKPFLLFVERTWNATGVPMHTETGYVRSPSPDTVEIVAAIPTGQSELGLGGCSTSDDSLTLTTDAEVRCTPTAKHVDRIVRRYHLRGDELDYTMEMSAVGQGLTLHLRAHLRRQDVPASHLGQHADDEPADGHDRGPDERAPEPPTTTPG